MSKESPSLQELIDSGVIRELNPELARKAIEGHEDVLAPAARVDEAFYRQFSCPGCGSSSLAKEYLGGPRGQGVTWTEDEVLPNALLRCGECSALFNPKSGMIVEQGVPVTLPEQPRAPGLTRDD